MAVSSSLPPQGRTLRERLALSSKYPYIRFQESILMVCPGHRFTRWLWPRRWDSLADFHRMKVESRDAGQKLQWSPPGRKSRHCEFEDLFAIQSVKHLPVPPNTNILPSFFPSLFSLNKTVFLVGRRFISPFHISSLTACLIPGCLLIPSMCAEDHLLSCRAHARESAQIPGA